MGVYESAEEILVSTDYHCAIAIGRADCVDPRFSRCAFHLHAVLT